MSVLRWIFIALAVIYLYILCLLTFYDYIFSSGHLGCQTSLPRYLLMSCPTTTTFKQAALLDLFLPIFSTYFFANICNFFLSIDDSISQQAHTKIQCKVRGTCFRTYIGVLSRVQSLVALLIMLLVHYTCNFPTPLSKTEILTNPWHESLQWQTSPFL